MSTTLTIRVDPAFKEALQERARQRGLPLSRYIRELLEKGMTPPPMRDRTGHLRGSIRLASAPDNAWTAKIRERNWRT
jgi:predicted DNA-binding ribbon-helix-helix protein